jgi:hypothetical protein
MPSPLEWVGLTALRKSAGCAARESKRSIRSGAERAPSIRRLEAAERLARSTATTRACWVVTRNVPRWVLWAVGGTAPGEVCQVTGLPVVTYLDMRSGWSGLG